jgi:hypothetical protein
MHEELSDLHKVILINFSKIWQNNRKFLRALKANNYPNTKIFKNILLLSSSNILNFS